MHASSSKDIARFEKEIGYSFKNISLLVDAFTHKSFAHENQTNEVSFNERMEFLGDAVLELVISEYLYREYSAFTEADLSRIKSYAVQESTLADIAKKLHVGKFLRLGKGEEITGGRKKPSLLADAFEALLAAMYLDSGYRKTREFILRHFIEKINKTASDDFIFDFKTRLQEVVQAKFGVLPDYVTHKEEGPEHEKVFEVKVYINDKVYGSGKGKSKKSAAQIAAKAGLKKIQE
jgi:ribonuclease-3